MTLTMLIEERYKDEDTGSGGVNSLPKLELSYSAGVCFFLLKQAKRTIINLKIKKERIYHQIWRRNKIF